MAHLTITASIGSIGSGLAIALGAGVALAGIGLSAVRWLDATPADAGSPR